jgi:hypothetical protein
MQSLQQESDSIRVGLTRLHPAVSTYDASDTFLSTSDQNGPHDSDFPKIAPASSSAGACWRTDLNDSAIPDGLYWTSFTKTDAKNPAPPVPNTPSWQNRGGNSKATSFTLAIASTSTVGNLDIVGYLQPSRG